jgi:monoamine oxidase
MTMLDIAIIGGGLSGLSLAKYLLDAGRDVILFESRERFGGRIVSLSMGDHYYDLGPSWVWPAMQPRLARFIETYNIEVFPQWLSGKSLYQSARELAPQSFLDHSTYESARRIHGGTYGLIDVLLQQLPQSLLKVNHHLQEVIDHHDHVELNFGHGSELLSIKAKQVVITIPPRLLVNTVTFTPGLDSRLSKVMNETATWMAGHAKVVIRYGRPFWREAGLSGSVLADYPGAAMAEIFDACPGNHEQAALSGFFALPPSLRQRYANDLPALIREQLVRLFGKEAAQPEEILIKDWFAEPATATHEDEIPPPAHPQYGHAWLQLDHWNDKLYFSGTETAPQFGGYLEGALESTERVAKALLI